MNVWSVAAMGVGAMVGAGIFALLGVVGLVAGDETYISFLLGGVVAVLSGYSYAKSRPAIRMPVASLLIFIRLLVPESSRVRCRSPI